MSEITRQLVDTLAAYGRKRMTSARVDDVREDVLDHAFEDLDFDGDEDALWDAVREAITASATASQLLKEQSAQTTKRGPAEKGAPPWDPVKDGEHVTAPFRFVPLNEKVSALKDAPCPHNDPQAERLSAVIDVDWQVETPLLIGETVEAPDGDRQVVEPFRLGEGWAIPGATLRGALRSVVEIAAAGRLTQLNRHARFALRDFEHPRYKAFIERTTGRPGLQAGWLCRIGERPHIVPCAWGYVRIADLIGSENENDTSNWAHKDRVRKYRDRGIVWQGTDAFSATEPFADSGEHQGLRLFRPGDSNRKGHLVVSGAVPGKGIVNKKYEYVFFDTGADPVPVSDTAWDVFETSNCKPSQNARKPDGSWAEFHGTYMAGGRVPVFYVGSLAENATDRDFSFGLTRLYRIPHAQSVGEVLTGSAPAHRLAEKPGNEAQPDFVDALFGYVHEPPDLVFGHAASDLPADYHPPEEVARKSRVTFDFALPVDPGAFRLWPENGPVTTIMGPPKPSFAPFYLSGMEKDYSASGNDLALAGRKRYLARHRPGQDGDPGTPLLAALRAQNADVSDDTKTHLRFLAPSGNARFRGRIRLHNVSRAELGAILWAVTLGADDKARHLIGRGKPFGAGQVLAAALRLHVRRNAAWKTPEEPLNWRHEDGAAPLQDWFDAFGEKIAALAGLPSAEAWRKGPSVRGVLEAARPRGWTEPQTGYLPYIMEGRQAKAFADLRKKTGIGVARNNTARRPPEGLLQT